jgi:hypothetical protein
VLAVPIQHHLIGVQPLRDEPSGHQALGNAVIINSFNWPLTGTLAKFPIILFTEFSRFAFAHIPGPLFAFTTKFAVCPASPPNRHNPFTPFAICRFGLAIAIRLKRDFHDTDNWWWRWRRTTGCPGSG